VHEYKEVTKVETAALSASTYTLINTPWVLRAGATLGLYKIVKLEPTPSCGDKTKMKR
jgi:hypothetical protein